MEIPRRLETWRGSAGILMPCADSVLCQRQDDHERGRAQQSYHQATVATCNVADARLISVPLGRAGVTSDEGTSKRSRHNLFAAPSKSYTEHVVLSLSAAEASQ